VLPLGTWWEAWRCLVGPGWTHWAGADGLGTHCAVAVQRKALAQLKPAQTARRKRRLYMGSKVLHRMFMSAAAQTKAQNGTRVRNSVSIARIARESREMHVSGSGRNANLESDSLAGSPAHAVADTRSLRRQTRREVLQTKVRSLIGSF